MANSFLTTDWLSMEALVLLTNKLEVSQFMNTSWNSDFEKPFAPGETVRIKYTPKFTVRNGIGYNPQAINEIYTTVSCNQTFGVDFEWNDVEAALKLERGDSRITDFYIKSPIAQIAQEWDDRSALFAYQNSNNIAGVLGTNPTSFQTYSAAARQALVEKACPVDGKRGMIIAPQVNTSLVASVATVFNPADEIAREFKKGIIGTNQGFEWYESMSLQSHTAGTWASTVSVYGAGQSGSSLVITATAGDTFKVGDVFGIASVYPVNPMTRRRTQSANTMTFVVTADLTAVGGAGADTLSISPPIYGPGSQYQNVDALPGNSAALTLFPGTNSPNGKSGVNGLALHIDAFAMVNVPLELPSNQQIAKQQRDPDTGMAIRFVRAWDPVQSKMINRFDTLGGYGVLYNNCCSVRMLGA